MAAVIWERDGKRGYRFEDGSERTFKDGYYQLFEAVALDGAGARKLLADIEHYAAVAEAVASGRAPAEKAATLEELVAVFRESYPDGFADPKWAKRVRGEGSRRRAKRHRDAALRDAARMLAAAALDELLAVEDAAGVLRRMADVMAATDLVTPKQIEAFRAATPRMDLARSMRDLLHQPDPEGIHFNRTLQLLVRAGVKRPAWQLLSGLRMLVDPQLDLCIRPSVFFTMTRTLSPRPTRKVSPEGGQYNRLSAMGRDLRDRLREAGELPRDMLDVYDFIWVTCRPAAKARLAQMREEGIDSAEEVEVAEVEVDTTAANDRALVIVTGATTSGAVSARSVATVSGKATLVRAASGGMRIEGATALEAEAA